MACKDYLKSFPESIDHSSFSLGVPLQTNEKGERLMSKKNQPSKDYHALTGDIGRAQQRIRNLADPAARNLCVEKLHALNITIAAYLPAEIYEQVAADLKSERGEVTRWHRRPKRLAGSTNET